MDAAGYTCDFGEALSADVAEMAVPRCRERKSERLRTHALI